MAFITIQKDGTVTIADENGMENYADVTIYFDDEYDLKADGNELGYGDYSLKDVAEVFRAIQKTKHFTDYSFDNGVDVGVAVERARHIK